MAEIRRCLWWKKWAAAAVHVHMLFGGERKGMASKGRGTTKISFLFSKGRNPHPEGMQSTRTRCRRTDFWPWEAVILFFFFFLWRKTSFFSDAGVLYMTSCVSDATLVFVLWLCRCRSGCACGYSSSTRERHTRNSRWWEWELLLA